MVLLYWSQYDGGNVEQRTMGCGCRQNQKAKLKIVGGDIMPCKNYQFMNIYIVGSQGIAQLGDLVPVL